MPGQRLADLEGRDIALAVHHAAPHVGVDGDIAVADQDLARPRRRHGGLGQLEVVGGRQAVGAGFQADFVVLLIVHGTLLNP